MLVRLSFLTLHRSHAATILVHDVSPPFERGMTCSNVRSFAENVSPQY
jgi:hypothetical protein